MEKKKRNLNNVIVTAKNTLILKGHLINDLLG